MLMFTGWLRQRNLLAVFQAQYNSPKQNAGSGGGPYDDALARYVNGFYQDAVAPAIRPRLLSRPAILPQPSRDLLLVVATVVHWMRAG